MRTVAWLVVLAAAGNAEGPARVYTEADGATAPRVISKSAPDYTAEAQMARLTGDVSVKLIVDEDGTLRDVHVSRALGMGLDQMAVDAVKSWQFAPGMMDGKPVPVLTTVTVSFQVLAGRTDWRTSRERFDGPVRTLAMADFPPSNGPEEHGEVTLSFDIDETGVPQNIHVEKSNGEKWEPEVVAILQQWRFEPGKRSHFTLDFVRGKSGT